ncbi:uncharacterized protein LOC111242131 [Vigna radiata var. radiata]|uniref:Uncharacterized protein LOC111242131 n=1 Tax=Vigna radiata var. radiata TaxID=3916 RepID=A0A3Q0FCT5_VIGRR|nr:uncharacterized protein LOC111242131 [Vigna radiata var. radiata]
MGSFDKHGSSSCKLKKGKGTTNVYVDGCIYMLQVWFCENFISPQGSIEKFPRILHWMNIHLGDNFVKGVMETGVVHHDVDFGIMKDKKVEKDDQPRPKMKEDKPSTKKLLKRKRREFYAYCRRPTKSGCRT